MKNRSEEETKTELLSFKVSKNQKKMIKEMAEKDGKDVSKFIVEKTLHPGCIKPQKLFRFRISLTLHRRLHGHMILKKPKKSLKRRKNYGRHGCNPRYTRRIKVSA